MEGYKSFNSFSNYLSVFVDTKLQIFYCYRPFLKPLGMIVKP